ncbi:MAG TPA: hypothetical protein VFK37_02735 [Bacillales bacterium]|nr:hypothetical protein [Bacillales bacterium]
MKGFLILLTSLLTFALTGCSQNVSSNQSFSHLQKQMDDLKKQNQTLTAEVKQLKATVQSLNKRLSKKSEPVKPASLNLPNDFVKVTDTNEVQKALQTVIPSVFHNDPKAKKWQIKRIKPLSQVDTYYQMGIKTGGKKLADLSWFVEVHFPAYEPSASLSTYQLFIAKSKEKGWIAWYVY